MDISPYEQYLITNRVSKGGFESIKTTATTMGELISESTVDISPIHTYEIYTCNPDTGERGWDIKHIASTDMLVKSYPLFDTIITRNDVSPLDGEWLDFDLSLQD